jgi:class 3 adenylate cyclase/tetratricopeptide (TPR) repeat protein
VAVKRCAACGREAPDDARFCPQCGRPFAEVATARHEERKVVTVVFADLVGFTSRAERMDPEDVRALLSPYYTRLRSELERFGGTVEKFIGDAVMALFGAPVAHEDDPERGVRAALAIRDWVLEQGDELQVRIAVHTGEALVALDARPSEGEGMASGDVVNTASRLQAAAPVNGVIVSDTTYRATSRVISYEPAEPVVAKGKSAPLAAWRAVEPRSRLGSGITAAPRTALIGRTREVSLLLDAFARVMEDRTAQLVTVIGVPGIGKSRVIGELFRAAEAQPDVVLWRQGRSLPYGDGVTFWALAEMVKAQAGILETDSPERAGAKLHRSIAEVAGDETDARWIEGHLRPLAGLGADAPAGGDRRSEAFTAWRCFFELLAQQHPLVLVFEDLHWADDNLLDFIDSLLELSGDLPMLVVCGARPELLERRPGWGGGKRNALTLSLSPLSDDETARLIGEVLAQPVMSLAVQESLLIRAGGNPLYAEQYARMLAECGDIDEVSLPESVQGIIAARIDGLSLEDKEVLQNAAVIGKVFWLGAAAVLGDSDRSAVESSLRALQRKDFVQRDKRSSAADEPEYSFLHVLVRDVAYGQIPRAQRAEKHRRAAQWLAALCRTEDTAEMLAHHYSSAVELLRASSARVDVDLADAALRSLREAGRRAMTLNAFPTAARYFAAALELAPPGSVTHAKLLLDIGRTQTVRLDLDTQGLEAAVPMLLAHDEPAAAAEAEAILCSLNWVRGDGDEASRHLDRSRALVEPLAPTPDKAKIVVEIARFHMLRSENAAAVDAANEALEMAESFGLELIQAAALDNRGVARWHLGDPGGMDDLERSAWLAKRVNSAWELCRALNNHATLLWVSGRLAEAAEKVEQMHAFGLRFGEEAHLRWKRFVDVNHQFTFGNWDEALRLADLILAEVESGSPHYMSCEVYLCRAHIRFGRDDAAGALRDLDAGLDAARRAQDPQVALPVLGSSAGLLVESGDRARADGLATECLDIVRTRTGLAEPVGLQQLAWALAALGRETELLDALASSPTAEQQSLWLAAAVSFARGDLSAAVDACRRMGALTEEARDRLWLAQQLIAEGRRAQGEPELHAALRFYRSVRATRYIREAEELLAASA